MWKSEMEEREIGNEQTNERTGKRMNEQMNRGEREKKKHTNKIRWHRFITAKHLQMQSTHTDTKREINQFEYDRESCNKVPEQERITQSKYKQQRTKIMVFSKYILPDH